MFTKVYQSRRPIKQRFETKKALSGGESPLPLRKINKMIVKAYEMVNKIGFFEALRGVEDLYRRYIHSWRCYLCKT